MLKQAYNVWRVCLYTCPLTSCIVKFIFCLRHPTLSAKALCFRAVHPLCSFIRTDLVTAISPDWLEQC